MTDQEDPMRTTIKPVHRWTPAGGESPQKPRTEKWLFGMLLLWPIFVWIFGMFGAVAKMPFTDYLVFFGSPVVAAILAGIAIRHYPATRKFLKTLVGLLLIVTILWGGIFQCVSLAHKEKLLSTMEHTTPRVTFITYRTLVSQPLFPVSDADANATLRGALVGVFGYASLFLSPYTPMLGPYYLLILLITPPFLAFPIFWLWLVLSVLYVILPSRAWRWMRRRGRPSVRGALSSLLMLCLLLTSCAASPGEKTAEALGFSGGNIGQGGLMGGDNNGNVYYRSEADHWYLYKAKLDGSAKQKLSDDVPCNINVLNGWVYYANYRDGFSIYRIRTDGTGHALLETGYCSNLYVVGRHIYYDVRDEANTPHIHRMDIDGSNDELLVSEARLSYYYGDSLYYTNSKLYLCKYDLATGTSTQLNDKYSHYVTVNQNGVYCWNPDENTFVHMNYDGGDSKVILSGGDFFNVSDKYVYYMKYGGSYDFYRLSLDTGEQAQLSSFMPGSFDASGKIIENPDPVASEESNVFHEGGSFTYVIEGRAFTRATLRQSMLQKSGRLDCLVRLDGAGTMQPWD